MSASDNADGRLSIAANTNDDNVGAVGIVSVPGSDTVIPLIPSAGNAVITDKVRVGNVNVAEKVGQLSVALDKDNVGSAVIAVNVSAGNPPNAGITIIGRAFSNAARYPELVIASNSV